jgi:hypothetical protein
MNYLHLHIEGHPNGYYEESLAWRLVDSVPQRKVKFLAGTLTRTDIDELRQKSRDNYLRPLPIYDS